MADSDFASPTATLRVRIEENMVFIRVAGSMTLADFMALSEIYQQLRRERGRFFALFDATRMDGIDREARRALGNKKQLTDILPAVTAIFGASFAVRTIGNMIDRARTGLGRTTTVRRFFDTEAQARAYIAQERARLVNTR
ncbi:MAG TPA: STAS/SEC14 domain-containing protein [Polyangium sp.]|nr:STAS/SEC14 domain-containing protein [Polyangium sp.]